MLSTGTAFDRRPEKTSKTLTFVWFDQTEGGQQLLKIDFSPKLVKNLSSTQEIPADPMKIEIKLFANFREYLPPGSEKYSCWLDLEEGTTVGQALERLKIPLSIPMIALVNGLHRTFEDRLQPGDVLSIFPPVAGG